MGESPGEAIIFLKALLADGRPGDALASIDESIRDRRIGICPADVKLLVFRSVALRELGRDNDALAAAEDALSIDGTSGEAHAARALALIRLNRVGDGCVSVDMARPLLDDPDLLASLAFACAGVGEHERAAGLFADLAQKLGHPRPLVDAAQQYFEAQAFDKALQASDAALARGASQSPVYVIRASALLGLGRSDEARASAEAAIAIEPKDSDGWRTLGLAAGDSGDFERARASFIRATELAPDDAAAWGGLGAAHGELGDSVASETAFRRSVALRPDVDEGWIGLGTALSDQGRDGEALGAFDEALRINPDHARAFAGRGFVHLNLSQYQAALRDFEASLSRERNHAIVLATASTLMLLHEPARALPLFDECIAADASQPEFWRGKGAAHLRLGELENAARALEELVALLPTDEAAWVMLGDVYAGLERWYDAYLANGTAYELRTGKGASAS